jgi:hypothetical protein
MIPNIDDLLKQTGRPALVGEEVADPSGNVLCRQGPPLAAADESWPLKDDVPLLPILSIHTRELPFVPAFLQGFDYWTFFVDLETCEQIIKDGSLVVRRYKRALGLRPLPPPPSIKPQPIGLRFRKVIDYPCDEALYDVWSDRPELLQAHEARAAELRDRFPCHSGIKIGGYPLLIQPTAFLKTLDPNFQIQIDISNSFHYGDSGIGYLCMGLSYAVWETI